MKPLLLLFTFVVSAAAEPAVYINLQTVTSTHTCRSPGRLISEGRTQKDDGVMFSAVTYHQRPELRERADYECTTPEGETFTATKLVITEGGKVSSYDEPNLAPVTLGWRQFKLGVSRMIDDGEIRWASYGGRMAIDCRGGDRDWEIAFTLTSDEGENLMFSQVVKAGQLGYWSPKLTASQSKGNLWTLTSMTPYMR